MSLASFTELQVITIAYLAGSGATAAEIADDARINATPAQIIWLVDRLGLPALPKPGNPRAVAVTIPASLFKALSDSARARNIQRWQLAERILTEVLASQLVGAVLDDGVS